MMQHAQANFDMKYFMKADDDTFVNVPIILHMLQTRTDDHFVYIGKRMTRHEYAFCQSLPVHKPPAAYGDTLRKATAIVCHWVITCRLLASQSMLAGSVENLDALL